MWHSLFGRFRLFKMVKSRQRASGELVLCFALRHLGTEREILVLKVKGNNFYGFPPYAKKPIGPVDCHISWHASGERHAVSRFYDVHVWKKDVRMQRRMAVKLHSPADLKGVGPLYHSGVF